MEKLYYIKSSVPLIVSLGVIAFGFIILRSKSVSPKGAPKSETRSGAENTMEIKSSAFQHNTMIPKKYSCDGENINPPLEISNVPPEAQSLVLIMHDPDAPFAGGWTHWIIFNMDPSLSEIKENSKPSSGTEGLTSFGKSGYGGPCPPTGTHHYEFKLYALDSKLSLDENATKTDLEKVMFGHILQETTLIGLYKL